MSLFVHPENQKILWNIVSGNPFIIRYFEAKSPQAKEMWFKQSIEDFYTRLQGKQIDPNELNNLNKEHQQHIRKSADLLERRACEMPLKSSNPCQSTSQLVKR